MDPESAVLQSLISLLLYIFHFIHSFFLFLFFSLSLVYYSDINYFFKLNKMSCRADYRFHLSWLQSWEPTSYNVSKTSINLNKDKTIYRAACGKLLNEFRLRVWVATHICAHVCIDIGEPNETKAKMPEWESDWEARNEMKVLKCETEKPTEGIWIENYIYL